MFSSWSSSPSSTSTPSTTSNIKSEQLKQEVTQQLALANAQELINKINEKCYARCIQSPSATLTAREQKMISNCMDRYLEAYNIISRTYVNRITKQRNLANQSTLESNSL